MRRRQTTSGRPESPALTWDPELGDRAASLMLDALERIDNDVMVGEAPPPPGPTEDGQTSAAVAE